MQQPILVVNQNVKRESGRKAQLNNTEAAKTVASLIQSTLGPCAMLKMILDPMGATQFEIKKIGDEYFTFITGCQKGTACSILLRGASKDELNEMERSLHDACA